MTGSRVLITVQMPSGQTRHAGIAEVAAVLGIAPEVLDRNFGAIAIDPSANLYSVMIGQDALRELSEDAKRHVEGPYANPKITPFGRPD